MIYRSIIQLININGIGYLLTFLTSVVIFRTVDKTFYGLYVIILSLFAIVDLLMAGLNDAIVRFLKDRISVVDKQNIVLFVLYYKYALISLFVFSIYLVKQYDLLHYLITDYNKVENVIDSFLFVSILNGFISTFVGINNCILNSQYKYKYTANIGLAISFFYLTIVVILSFITKDYLHYLYANTLASSVLLLFLHIKIGRDFPEMSLKNLIKVDFSMTVWRKYIYCYAMPLTGSSFLTYIKNHLPIIILGKEFSLSDVAVFSIIKTFFKALHSASGSFINPMMSRFLELKNNSKEYSKYMNEIFYSSFGVRLLVFIALFFVVEYFFLIYEIDNNSMNRLVFYILGVEYIIAGARLSYGIPLRLNKNTNAILKIAITRFVVELLLIYFILIEYGIIAAALILLISRYVETLSAYIFVKNQRVIVKTEYILIVFSLIVFYFSYNVAINPL